MALKIGVVGLGFMGKMHFDVYTANEKSEVTHIFDLDEKKLKGDWGAIGGNIEGAGGELVDLSKITMTDKFEDLLESDLDIIDVCLPTNQHSKYAVPALEAGKNTFCEKPMGISLEDATKILDAWKASGKKLQIGHCIRFWPEYATLKKLLDEKKYGEVKAATFTRLSPCPTWSWNNWLMNADDSGAAALDLHVHDTDFVNFAFGRPKSVTSHGASLMTTGMDHIVTAYNYGDGKAVTAEGGWMGMPDFPFRMEFQVMCESASIEMNGAGFKAYAKGGGAEDLPKEDGDGWQLELDYFLECVQNDKDPEIVTPEDALEAVEIVLAEIESAKAGGKEVAL